MSSCQFDRPRADGRDLHPKSAPQNHALTAGTRAALERLLLSRRLPDPVTEILRDKLATARCVTAADARDHALPDQQITFMVSGGGAQRVHLTLDDAPGAAGRLPVTSLLGATLLGMRRLQKARLPREGGETAVLVVLDTFGT